MVALSKPELYRIWASGAPVGNVIDPDTTTPGKFNAGWVAEVPPFEHFNFLQNHFTKGLAYLNEQGVSEWDSTTTYPVNSIVKGSNGALYQTLIENTNNDPTTETSGNYQPLFNENTTLDFLNLTAAKATPLKTGQVVQTHAYYPSVVPFKNKGGAKYVVVTTAQYTTITGIASPDNFVDHATTNGKVLMMISQPNSYNVGAKGDNANDDLTALQYGLDRIGKTGGGQFDILNGSYKFVDNFATGVNQFGLVVRYNNIKINFESKNAILYPNRAVQQKTLSVTSDVSVSSPATQLSNIEITGGTIDGQNDQSGAVTNEYSHALDLRNAKNVNIHNMNLKRFKGDGLYCAYGCVNVLFENNIVDGNRSATISGVRQAVAVLSGNNIVARNNRLTGCLIGLDLEPDDNQIDAGYNYAKNIFFMNNLIENMSSEGFDLIAPLATSALTIENVYLHNNIFIDVSENIMDIDLAAVNGNAKKVSICNNLSNGSQTFKGLGIRGVDDIQVINNNFGSCYDIVVHLTDRVTNAIITNNIGNSTNNDGLRIQESTSATRIKTITVGVNHFVSANGEGLQIQGAFEIEVNGGFYKGTTSGIAIQGTGVAGTATDAWVEVNNAKFECTNSANNVVTVAQDIQMARFNNCKIAGANGATSLVTINSAVSGVVYFFNCKPIIGVNYDTDMRKYITNNTLPFRVITKDPHNYVNTSAELTNAASYANKINKYAGAQVFDTTTNKILSSTSNTTTSTWVDAMGTVVYTPV